MISPIIARGKHERGEETAADDHDRVLRRVDADRD